MKITLLPIDYSEELTCDGLIGLPKEFLNELGSDFSNSKHKVEFSDVSFGLGADWVWLIVSIYTLKEIVKEGEALSKGIKGWAEIGKSILGLKKKSRRIILDAQAIDAICIESICRQVEQPDKIEKIFQHERKNDRNSGYGTMIIDSYFVLEFIVNDRFLFVFGSNSNGELEVLKKVDLKKDDFHQLTDITD